jgi:hypothetical protein
VSLQYNRETFANVILSRALQIKWQGPLKRNKLLQQVAKGWQINKVIMLSQEWSNRALTSRQGSMHFALTKFLLLKHVDVTCEVVHTLR